MKDLIARFVEDDAGATSIEYGLIGVLIAVVLVAVIGKTGSGVKRGFTSVNNGLSH